MSKGQGRSGSTEARRALEEAHALEKQHSELSKKLQPADPALAALRNDLRDRYRQLLVKHVDFACRKGVDRVLWLVIFHKRIEFFRRKVRKASAAVEEAANAGVREAAQSSLKRANAGLEAVLREGTVFYEELVTSLQEKNQVDCFLGRTSPSQPLGSTGELARRFLEAGGEANGSSTTAALRSVCASCALSLGDLARYRELHASGTELDPAQGKRADWSAAQALYIAAHQAQPQNGNAHNQLAVVATYAGDELGALYHYMSALASRVPFNTGTTSGNQPEGEVPCGGIQRRDPKERDPAVRHPAERHPDERGWSEGA